MHGLMMDFQLTITSIMAFAERAHGQSEIVSVTHDHPRHRYTYTEAFRRIRQLANALDQLGAKPDDIIGTLAWNDHRHFELYYAVSCSGMICHTINPRLFSEQIEFVINQAEDKFIFLDPLFLPIIEPLVDKLNSVKGLVVLSDETHMPETGLNNVYCYESLLSAQPDTFEFPELAENQASSLCYTSGTTGHPKGVLYDHRATVMHAYASCMEDVMGLGRGGVVMPLVPMFHVNAWGVPYSTVMVGSKLVFPGPKMLDGKVLTQLINEEQVSYSLGVPTIWLALLDYLDKSGEKVESLDRIVVGGAACPLSIMERFDSYGVYSQTGWGMTEMSPLGTFSPRLDRDKLGEEQFARLRMKAGVPIYGVELKIVDEQDNELPWDGKAFGALKVRGPWVCKSYFKLENSEAHDENGWFDTGDVATISAEGFLQITDRSKDVIKSGGEWISSIDLENTAANHPAVAEAAVIGMPHPKWTERPLLLVVLAEGKSVDKSTLLNWFTGKVADWWIPDDCLFVDTLPHTATGKLDKKLMRKQHAAYRFPQK